MRAPGGGRGPGRTSSAGGSRSDQGGRSCRSCRLMVVQTSGCLYNTHLDVNRQSAQGAPRLDDTLMKSPPTSRSAGNLSDDTPRQSGLTLWRQIAETLRQEIGGTGYPPGARLPTEAELSARFAVNRHTVRRALEELSRGGLIRVEQGRGTFVAEDVLDYTVGPRTRFTEWIHRHNKEPSGRVLQRREVAADSTIATALGIRAGTRVVLLERVGLAND